MSDGSTQRRPRLAWVIWAATLCLLVFVLVLGTLNGGQVNAEEVFLSVLAVLAIVTSSTVGAMVASRQPRSPIGWLFMAFPVGMVLGILGEDYAVYAVRTNPGALPASEWVAWLGRWTWFTVVAIPLIMILFPTGSVPTPRWRWAPRILIVGAACSALLFALDPRPTTPTPGLRPLPNPVGIETLRSPVGALTAAAGIPAFLAGIACFIGLVVRFRRARGEERQQLRWLAYAGGASFTTLVLLFASDPVFGEAANVTNWIWAIFVFSLFVGIPVACGIAILKFRLYDLDVVIKKTVVFGIVALFVTATYVVVVIVIGTAITGGGARISGTFFAATALIALALQPLRERARRLANRLVYGRRATPYEVLSKFTEGLEEAASVDDVAPRMARLITEGTGASRAIVWLRVGRMLRAHAVWPTGSEPSELEVDDGDLPHIPGATTTIPVTHRGELLGAISIEVPSTDPLTPTQERLLAELATQAGVALRNVALTTELRERLQQLEQSRKRLVTAQDQERRRIERNLHDGAQQQLVALSVKERLAASLIDRKPAEAKRLLEQVQSETTDALETLRDLARGIYPPLLADQGLQAALEAQARRSAIAVELEVRDISRYARDVESAVYFCSLEALNNIVKYADATTAQVTVAQTNGDLVFQIIDDGRGFDTSVTSYGTGLQGMVDRLDAVGGSVDVSSTPGRGTVVTGRIPL